MNRFLNKTVVITLETGVGVKGIPTSWNEEEVIVTYPDSDNYTVIFNPSENIMMVSVYRDVEESEPYVQVQYASDLVEAGEPDPGYDRVVEPPEPKLDHFEPDPQLRVLKLADLHVKKTEAVKDMLHKHFKNRVAIMPEGSAYDSPDFT